MYKKLEEYKTEHGHCRVPASEPLGRWVSDQRTYRRDYESGKKTKGRMTSTRIESLNKLGFVWNMDDYRFEQVGENVESKDKK